jgi:hypothetical protein
MDAGRLRVHTHSFLTNTHIEGIIQSAATFVKLLVARPPDAAYLFLPLPPDNRRFEYCDGKADSANASGNNGRRASSLS